MKNENKSVIIDIKKSIFTESYEVNNVIHKDILKQVLCKINEYKKIAIKEKDKNNKSDKCEKNDNSENFKRVHQSIVINGERGGGKTSFMLSIKNLFEKQDNKIPNDIKECINNNKDFAVLDILDPTLVTSKQNVLILLIAMIDKKVKECIDKCEKKEDKEYDSYKDSLKQLADGLNQLEDIGKNPYQDNIWDEAILILDRGLKIAESGLDLEKNFHKFIDNALKFLDKKVFLLFIDDIDTDFKKGIEVLEVLRKYITTQKIIPIIAGNFELYEQLIRDDKSRLFKNLIEFESKTKNIERLNLITNQVNELTQQYLMKIMQPLNTFYLKRLYYYLNYTDIKFQIKNENEEMCLKEYLEKKVFKEKFTYYYNDYIEIFTNLPLRTFFQFLYQADSLSDRKEFISKLIDVFIEDFLNLGIKRDFFDKFASDKGIDYFVLEFIDKFNLEEVENFKPLYLKNINKNIALVLLPQYKDAFLANSLSDRFYKYFEWGIKVCMQYFILYKLLNINNNIENNKKYFLLDKFLDIERKLDVMILRIFELDKTPTLPIYELTYKNKKALIGNEMNFEILIKKIENKIKNSQTDENIRQFLLESLFFAKLPYFLIKVKNFKRNDAISYMYILELFFKSISLNEKNSLKSELNKKWIEKILDYKLFEEKSDTNQEDEEYGNEIDEGEEEHIIDKFAQLKDEFIENLISAIINWNKSFKEYINQKELKYHILEINEMFFNYLKKLEKQERKYDKVDEYIKMHLAKFFNELIVYTLEKEPNKIAEEVSSFASLTYFINNLGKLKDSNKDIFYLIIMFLSHPIIAYYIFGNYKVFEEYYNSQNNIEDNLDEIFKYLEKLKLIFYRNPFLINVPLHGKSIEYLDIKDFLEKNKEIADEIIKNKEINLNKFKFLDDRRINIKKFSAYIALASYYSKQNKEIKTLNEYYKFYKEIANLDIYIKTDNKKEKIYPISIKDNIIKEIAIESFIKDKIESYINNYQNNKKINNIYSLINDLLNNITTDDVLEQKKVNDSLLKRIFFKELAYVLSKQLLG